ncbi:MAG: penicillin-binding protein, partial [Lachnospiraceae bacterium]|nr:penicillin-binding protein [Lachnospiraceae bacterium]
MAKKRRKKKKTYIGTFFSVFFKSLLIVIVLGIIAAGAIGLYFYNKYYKEFDREAKEIVENGSSDDFKKNEPTYFYDKNGDVIAKLRGDGDSTYLSYDEIPENAINAFIAVEDRTFWKNPGYDIQGIARVMIRYLTTRGVEQHGASTITQQLARNVYLSQEVSMRRKVKEILISKYLTKKYTKQEIMEYYVNNVYFANQYYGLEAAAQGYFGKKASQLSLSETAYLCSIPNRPAYYDPIKYPDNALKRRDKILADMLEEDMISKDDYELAVSEKISLKEQTNTELNDYQATFAMDCAVRYLMSLDGFEFRYTYDSDEDYKNYKALYDESYEEEKSSLYSNGYKIYTTLDSEAQDKLQTALDENLAFDDETSDTGAYAFQGAVTAIDNTNGKVIALVGGRTDPSGSSSTYTLNRAYQSYRQPGSSIKPLVVYAPGLEIGYAPGSILENIDVSAAKKLTALQAICLVGDPMTLRKAVEKSQNGCAWSVYANITPKVGLSHITKMEYQNIVPDDYNLATALGGFTNGVTTVEQASGYAALVNHGVYRGQTCLVSVKDNDGNELYVEPEEIQAYTAEAADTMI